jgi:plastocyanin
MATTTPPRRWSIALSRLAGASTLAAALLIAGAASVAAADEDVEIVGFAFSPQEVTVAVGDSVTWTNDDAAAHTASADDGAWNTSSIATGASGSITFSTAGTFPYHCDIHPTMTGTVVVQGAGGSPPPTDAVTVAGRAAAEPQAHRAALILAISLAGGLVLGLRRFFGTPAGR